MTLLEKAILKIRKSKRKIRLPRKVRKQVAQKNPTGILHTYPSAIGYVGMIASAFSLFLIYDLYHGTDDRSDNYQKIYSAISEIDKAQSEVMFTNTKRLNGIQDAVKDLEARVIILENTIKDMQKVPPKVETPKAEEPARPKKSNSGWIHIPERRGNYLRY